MVTYKKFICGELAEFCYLVYDNKTLDAVVIDPGSKDVFEKIDNIIKALHLNLKMVLLTHGHYDHIGACKKFQNNGIKIAINLLDADKCESDELCLIKLFGNGEILDKFKPDILFENEEDNLVLGSLNIKVIHTPGHSKGGSSYLIGNFLLSGDTIFEQGYGRTDFYDGSSIKLRQSIRKLLTYLNKGYILCCGH